MVRAVSGPIWDLWAAGGPYLGVDRMDTRVTVEIGWVLGEFNSPVGDFNKPPLRYVQTEAQDQVETLVPNVQSVQIDRSIDQDAATVTITLVNQQHNAVGDPNINPEEFGNPGYLTWNRGDAPASLTLWGHEPNVWNDVLVPNALIRTYQGAGGADKTLAQALEDGNLQQTGVWLLDEVKPSTGGNLQLIGRDLAKLLIDQPLYPPLVPLWDASGCDNYPLRYAAFFSIPGTQTATIYYGAGGAIATTRKIKGIEYAPTSSPCRPDLEGYWMAGDDGGVFCQPPDTLVTLAHPGQAPYRGLKGPQEFKFEDVPIQSVRPGDRVLSFDPKYRQLRRRGCVVSEVTQRSYAGWLTKVTTETGEESRYTADHKCIAIVGDAFEGKTLVYLMRKGNQFRVGIANGGRRYARNEKYGNGPVQKQFGVVGRCREEGGDAFWILSIHDDRADAALSEALVSLRSGLPSWQFPRPGKSIDHAMDLHEFWTRVGDNSEAADQLLRSLDKSIAMPFWVRDGRRGSGWTMHPRIMAAADLVSGMKVLLADHARPYNGTTPKCRETEAVPITVERQWYEGDVFSLHVEGDHTYVADGIITHNCYGYVDFHGSLSGITLNQPVIGMAATGTNNGYWLATADGGVFCYGDANFFESLPSLGVPVTNIVAIERSRGGSGYLLAGADGGVFAFGDAVYSGNGVGIITGTVVGFDVRQTGSTGYWLCTNTGHVYAFGAAGYFGGINGASGITDVVGFASTPSDNGYFLVRSDGAVYAYGDAQYHGGANNLTLNDPITDIAVHPSGGYWLAAEDGGVFTYGPGMSFYGSLPGPWVNLATVPGNYTDLSDVIKDIVRWAGLWLYDGGVSPEPHGTFESTGIVSNDQDGKLDEALFDRQPPINVINELKALVGYQFSIDCEGAARFSSPNWWAPGNYLPDGSHTDVLPEINEAVNMTNYGVLYGDKSMRSKITIASYQPLEGLPGTVVTDYTPANVAALRGLHKPFEWVNKVFVKPEEQQIMAELIDLHINMQRRLGSVSCVALPLLEIGDQVRIVERETSESYVHMVRGISTTHDLVSGSYMMTLQTNWLGDEDDWAIFIPSVIVRPETIQVTTTIGAVGITGAATDSPAPGTVVVPATIGSPLVTV